MKLFVAPILVASPPLVGRGYPVVSQSDEETSHGAEKLVRTLVRR